jgi:hypothetical protein
MTIQLSKAETKDIILTLSELRNESVPSNWLFRIVKDQGRAEYLLYMTDISASPERYNHFVMIEGVDITFENLGDHRYFAYQMPNGGSLDYTTGLLVEQGKLRVNKAESVTPSFNTTITSKVHE